MEKIIQFLKSRNVDWNSKDLQGVKFIEAVLFEENDLLIALLAEEGILEKLI